VTERVGGHPVTGAPHFLKKPASLTPLKSPLPYQPLKGGFLLPETGNCGRIAEKEH